MADFYEILGITEEEKKLSNEKFQPILKKKYKALAVKWHPDRFVGKSDEEKDNAETKFKEISEAYETLSDPEKRMKYDYGTTETGGFGGFSGFDRFSGFGGFPGFGWFTDMNMQRAIKGQDAIIDITLSLKEAYVGKIINQEYDCMIRCSHCHGTGAEEDGLEICPTCQGTGMFIETRATIFGVEHVTTICPSCGGSGKKIAKPCSVCNGSRLVPGKKTLVTQISPGVDNCQLMTTNMGSESPDENGTNGNLILNIKVDYGDCTRQGNNIYRPLKIHLFDALAGCTVNTSDIAGETISIDIPEMTSPGTKYKFAGKGMPPFSKNSMNSYNNVKGDLYFNVEYIMPTNLTEKDRNAIKSLQKSTNKKKKEKKS